MKTEKTTFRSLLAPIAETYFQFMTDRYRKRFQFFLNSQGIFNAVTPHSCTVI